MAQVTLKEVSKIYNKDILAVSKVNLVVKDKEFFVLVGPSGCGKSTTLRIIAGLEELTKGEVYIGNKLVNDVLPKDRDIAMVFQNYALYPHMTVYENMAFGLRLRKYPLSEIDKRVKDGAAILSIEKLLERKPRELSGGQKQRVAVGRAIVRKPQVFLFDEPLSNLDAKLRVQMRIEINKLHKRLQSTMIYVTHDQVEAMTMGDRIVVMKDGLVHQIADPLTLYEKPVNKFVAGFIGSPPMNFMEGRIIKKDSKFYFDEGAFKIKVMDEMLDDVASYEGKRVTLGIRPQDIYDKLFVSDAPPENIVTATVEVVEPMGSEVYVYLNSGKNTFVAKMGGHDKPQVNSDMDLVFDTSRVHFFDMHTEEAIA